MDAIESGWPSSSRLLHRGLFDVLAGGGASVIRPGQYATVSGNTGAVTADDLLPVLAVLPVEPSLHASAQARYRASLPSGPSFVDHVSFGVMTQEAIDAAFTLDADFVAAGVDVIPA